MNITTKLEWYNAAEDGLPLEKTDDFGTYLMLCHFPGRDSRVELVRFWGDGSSSGGYCPEMGDIVDYWAKLGNGRGGLEILKQTE